ncbi:uncharacterized protein LOC126986826 isoform X1 [Eriocheir sinensis]|uniref:uncharacterized protein LOC126986826 isoform X1 n=1 Tax=Eriocheir sinensis TaxID=95602 RepID=UPI0021C7BE83|nr:uncharacterized protein LOC126986826 isoform X1 [Eriocheir sinensis]
MADPLTNYPLLQQILPDAYEYRICKFKVYGKEENLVLLNKFEVPVTKFEATLRLKIKTKAEARLWIKELERTSAVTWRVDKTYPICGGKKTQNIYRVDMRCQHRTYSRSSTADKRASSKNTCCPAKMFLVVKRTHMASGKVSQSSDQYLQEFPTRVCLDFRHNHHLLSPESLKRRDVSEETVQKLTALYKAGHTPLTALEVIKRELQADYGDQYDFVSSDRSKCPDKQFCYRLYYKLFCPKSKKPPGKKMLLDLQSHLKPFCEKYASQCASIEKTEEDNVIIAICSPSSKKMQNHDNEENLKNANNSSFSVPQGIQTLNVESYTNQPQLMSELHSQSVRHCQEGLKAVFDDLVSKVECEPLTFLRPVNEFIHNYQSTKKDELVNALRTFSQCSEIAMAVARSLKYQQGGEGGGGKNERTTIICPKKRKGNRRKLIRARPLLQSAMQELNNDFDSELPALQIVTEDVASHELSHHEISAMHDISEHGISVVHDVTAHTPSHPDLRLHPAHLTMCADQQRRM